MSYSLCTKHIENVSHLLIGCHQVNFILNALYPSFPFHQYVHNSFQEIFHAFMLWARHWDAELKLLTIICMGFRRTWIYHNNFIFQE